MTATRSHGKYSCYEVALSGRDLSHEEKKAVGVFFLSCRVPQAALACTEYRGLYRVCYYTRAARRVSQLRRRFRTRLWKRITFRVKALGRHDWFDKWKRDYQLRPLGAKFMIVPVWERKKYKVSRRLPIFLEPGSAFGSGYHETTRLMVRLLESLCWRRAGFLDVGTGTGILSAVAGKLGAKGIVAFDNDKQSAIVARKNFEANGGRNGSFFGANLKTVRLKKRFEVVGANLLSKTLIENQKKIRRWVKPGGSLIVSGIGKENFEAFRKGFAHRELKCTKVLRGRKWVALVYKYHEKR